MYVPILLVDDYSGSKSNFCGMPNIIQIRGIIFVNIVPVLSRVPTTWQFTE